MGFIPVLSGRTRAERYYKHVRAYDCELKPNAILQEPKLFKLSKPPQQAQNPRQEDVAQNRRLHIDRSGNILTNTPEKTAEPKSRFCPCLFGCLLQPSNFLDSLPSFFLGPIQGK